MMGTVEFTFRVIKPIDFLLRLAGPRDRDRARTNDGNVSRRADARSCVALKFTIACLLTRRNPSVYIYDAFVSHVNVFLGSDWL